MRRILSTLLVTTCLAASAGGFAQTDEERAGARAAATEGAKAFMEGRWADCVDLMSRAESLVHSPTHLLYMARAYAKLGKLVKAHETYNKIVREQLPAYAPPAFEAAQDDAKKEFEALKPRVPYISVVVQGAGPLPVIVTMDGVTVPDALVGVPRPVDPGEHKFQAKAEGKESNVKTVTVNEGDRETVVLTLKEGRGLERGDMPAEEKPPAEAPTEAKPPETPQPLSQEPPTADTGPAPEDEGAPGLRIGAYAALGVGAVGLGLGTVFAIQHGSKRSEADDLYDELSQCAPACPQERIDAVDQADSDANSAGTLATVSFIVGGVGIASGVTLLLLSSGKKDAPADTAQARVEPWIGLGSAGLRGRF